MTDDRAKMIALLMGEADRRLGDVGRRLDGAATRAGVVIAGALVVAGLPAGVVPLRWLPLVFAGSAFFCALFSLLYGNAPEVPVGGLKSRLAGHSMRSMSDEILERKIFLIKSNERALTIRSHQLLLSYVALALAAGGVVIANL